jgi:hypothetical protein
LRKWNNTDVLWSWETGGYLEMALSVSNAMTRIDVMRLHSQAKGFSADRIEIWKRNQCIVRDIFTATFFSGLSNFMSHFGLNILMLGKEVKYPR